ncbi:LysE family transporter [Acinetobacter sp. RF14B]|uniref:LysE family transporter n=1 Tax=Acinetobacter sp. RF14B TaxID=2650965 RepID=UPI001D0DA8EF|nr:LysE family transporter [Acinetobacter sp. RF14B]
MIWDCYDSFFALITRAKAFSVTPSAIRYSRQQTLCAALGILLVFWVSVCALSCHFLFHKIIWLQQVLIIFGGFYLFYLGSLMLRSSLKLPFPDQKARVQSPTINFHT